MPGKPLRRPFSLALGCLAGALLLAPCALASHQFTDVPTSHQFHNEISIFKDTNITSGCTATTFCPDDPVKRQAMAAFIDRALGLVIRPGESTQKGVPGSRVTMLDDDLSFVGTSGNALAYRGPSDNVVGGASANFVNSGVVGATIAGGGADFSAHGVLDDYGSVGGGSNNSVGSFAGTTADQQYATVAGGHSNSAGDLASAVAGGDSNTAGGPYSVVAGGSVNTASGFASTVDGGTINTASGPYAAVAGGVGNTASGLASAAAGGYFNSAGGSYSLAAGYRAKANNAGSFVWADAKDFDFESLAANDFRARATGGAAFITGIDATTGAPTAGVSVSAGSGSWTSVSDRNAKRNFAAVDTSRILHRLAGVPITTWSYRAQRPSIRHIGPTAQDFRSAFRVGDSPQGITTVDADGVALAAIQGLYRRSVAQQREIARLKRENKRLAALERAVAELKRAK